MPLWMINRKDRLPIEVNAYSVSDALRIVSRYYGQAVTDFSVFAYGYVDPKRMNKKTHFQKYL